MGTLRWRRYLFEAQSFKIKMTDSSRRASSLRLIGDLRHSFDSESLHGTCNAMHSRTQFLSCLANCYVRFGIDTYYVTRGL
jgi:hypothetical protein